MPRSYSSNAALYIASTALYTASTALYIASTALYIASAALYIVIPAKAGIHALSRKPTLDHLMDFLLRGNDKF